jgi:hypothetical protein
MSHLIRPLVFGESASPRASIATYLAGLPAWTQQFRMTRLPYKSKILRRIKRTGVECPCAQLRNVAEQCERLAHRVNLCAIKVAETKLDEDGAAVSERAAPVRYFLRDSVRHRPACKAHQRRSHANLRCSNEK